MYEGKESEEMIHLNTSFPRESELSLGLLKVMALKFPSMNKFLKKAIRRGKKSLFCFCQKRANKGSVGVREREREKIYLVRC